GRGTKFDPNGDEGGDWPEKPAGLAVAAAPGCAQDKDHADHHNIGGTGLTVVRDADIAIARAPSRNWYNMLHEEEQVQGDYRRVAEADLHVQSRHQEQHQFVAPSTSSAHQQHQNQEDHREHEQMLPDLRREVEKIRSEFVFSASDFETDEIEEEILSRVEHQAERVLAGKMLDQRQMEPGKTEEEETSEDLVGNAVKAQQEGEGEGTSSSSSGFWYARGGGQEIEQQQENKEHCKIVHDRAASAQQKEDPHLHQADHHDQETTTQERNNSCFTFGAAAHAPVPMIASACGIPMQMVVVGMVPVYQYAYAQAMLPPRLPEETRLEYHTLMHGTPRCDLTSAAASSNGANVNAPCSLCLQPTAGCITPGGPPAVVVPCSIFVNATNRNHDAASAFSCAASNSSFVYHTSCNSAGGPGCSSASNATMFLEDIKPSTTVSSDEWKDEPGPSMEEVVEDAVAPAEQEMNVDNRRGASTPDAAASPSVRTVKTVTEGTFQSPDLADAKTVPRPPFNAFPPRNPGSCGHPHACAEACKYVRKQRGCKDGDNCDRCHVCIWRPPPRLAELRKQARLKHRGLVKTACVSSSCSQAADNEKQAPAVDEQESAKDATSSTITTPASCSAQQVRADGPCVRAEPEHYISAPAPASAGREDELLPPEQDERLTTGYGDEGKKQKNAANENEVVVPSHSASILHDSYRATVKVVDEAAAGGGAAPSSSASASTQPGIIVQGGHPGVKSVGNKYVDEDPDLFVDENLAARSMWSRQLSDEVSAASTRLPEDVDHHQMAEKDVSATETTDCTGAVPGGGEVDPHLSIVEDDADPRVGLGKLHVLPQCVEFRREFSLSSISELGGAGCDDEEDEDEGLTRRRPDEDGLEITSQNRRPRVRTSSEQWAAGRNITSVDVVPDQTGAEAGWRSAAAAPGIAPQLPEEQKTVEHEQPGCHADGSSCSLGGQQADANCYLSSTSSCPVYYSCFAGYKNHP
ncbi:unnamed protein product, partial [Amoebophrya sp. A120]